MSDQPGSRDDDRPPAAEVTDGGLNRATPEMPLGLPRWVVGIAPVVLLGVLLVGFVVSAPLSGLIVGEPVPDLTVTQAQFPDDDTMVLHVTNNGPRDVTIAQVFVDEAYWSFEMPGRPDNTIGTGETARVVIPYHWNEGFDYDVDLVLAEGATVGFEIEAAQPTPGLSGDLLWTLAVAGVFVGVIPVVLGMLWYPFLRTMSDRRLHAVLAFSAGILGFLAIDAGFEALELAEQVPGYFEGSAVAVLGVLGALLLVQSVSAWRENRVATDGGEVDAGDARPTGDSKGGLWVAYLVALSIGLHNLAEGLAIGSSFALGRVSLGAFLVVGFMLHNVTEGPAVVAPVARDERPELYHFGALGLLAGAPVIVGGWIGGLAFSPLLGTLFLAVGVGAILQVIWELVGMVERDGRVATATNLLAFLLGLVVMYATDLLVVI